MRIRDAVRIVVAGFIAIVLALPADAQSAARFEEREMGSVEPREKSAVDPELLAQFVEEYDATVAEPRAVFDKYIPILGPAALLDFLEERYPACHGQSHDLGKALFAVAGDLNQALRDCGTRCTSGCMHGAVGEAFGSASVETLLEKMNGFCGEGEMGRLHKPGNCAHALGHALMFVNGGDVSASIEHCLAFSGDAMQYYCATGVFMEKILTGPKSPTPDPSPHFPCDQETLFPAACYRYKSLDLLRRLGDHRKLAGECMSLDPARRRGCFHGLGAAVAHAVFETPASITYACNTGSLEDRIVCVEGIIEKLSDYDERRATEACRSLDGKLRQVCLDAAEGKMYNLAKATFSLYYDREAVEKRRGSRALSEDRSSHEHQGHAHHNH